jgi:hypothetical protein
MGAGRAARRPRSGAARHRSRPDGLGVGVLGGGRRGTDRAAPPQPARLAVPAHRWIRRLAARPRRVRQPRGHRRPRLAGRRRRGRRGGRRARPVPVRAPHRRPGAVPGRPPRREVAAVDRRRGGRRHRHTDAGRRVRPRRLRRHRPRPHATDGPALRRPRPPDRPLPPADRPERPGRHRARAAPPGPLRAARTPAVGVDAVRADRRHGHLVLRRPARPRGPGRTRTRVAVGVLRYRMLGIEAASCVAAWSTGS